MNRYYFLSHTADTRLFVEADSREELFSEAFLALKELLEPKSIFQHFLVDCTITISSYDETALLIDFLAEVLTYSHIKKAVFTKVHFLSFSKTELIAHLQGSCVPYFEKDVKAVTYHEAEIKKTETGFSTTIIFDI